MQSFRAVVSTLILALCLWMAGPGNPWLEAKQTVDDVVAETIADEWRLIWTNTRFHPAQAQHTYILECVQTCGPRSELGLTMVLAFNRLGYAAEPSRGRPMPLTPGWEVAGEQGRRDLVVYVKSRNRHASGAERIEMNIVSRMW